MDPELTKALNELRAGLGKNIEALQRADAIEAMAKKGDADIKVLRAELDQVKKDNDARETIIRDMQRQSQIVRAERDPIGDRRQAISVLGMIARTELARHLRQEVPAQFKDEGEIMRTYGEQVLQRATLAFNATPGSYLIPTILEQTIIDTLAQVSQLVGLVDYVPGLPMAGTINIPTRTGRPALKHARASSDTKMTQSDAAFGTTSLTPAEAYVYFPVDNNFLMMSPFPLGQILLNTLNEAIIQGIADDLLNADGTASYNSITGLLNETNADYIYSLPGGKKAFADVTAADLRGAKMKVLWQNWFSGRWLMNLDVLGVFDDMDRLGKVPVVKYSDAGEPRILTNPVVLEALMPAMAATAENKAFIGYGDLKTFLVGMAGGIRVASDTSYLFGNNQTAFRGTMLMDIKRKPTKTFVIVKTAAV